MDRMMCASPSGNEPGWRGTAWRGMTDATQRQDQDHGALLIISPDDVARVVTKAAVAVQVIAFDASGVASPQPTKPKL